MAKHILNLPIRKLTDSPYQGRFLSKEALKNIYTKKQLGELANSIEITGLLQPITVRAVADKYEIIDGHRRVEAFKILEKGNIPAIVKEGTEQEIQTMSVVANIQRINLSNLERALSFEKILKNGVFKSKKELSVAIGKDETYVGDILNLLKMDERIIKDLAKNNSITDVRMLRMIRNAGNADDTGRSDKQYQLYLKCLRDKLTRTQLNNLIKKDNKQESAYGFKLNYNNYGFQVKFNTKKLPGKKEKVMALIEQKMAEILAELEQEGY